MKLFASYFYQMIDVKGIFNVAKMKQAYFIVFILLTTISCHTKSVDQISPQSDQGVTVTIQPFNQFSQSTIKSLSVQLKKHFRKVIIKPAMPLPLSAFNSNRHRYRADSLIRFLKQTNSDSEVCIGLTDKDISTTKGIHADWGVMGLGYCPGKSCIVSTFRLSRKNTVDQCIKVALHELGHTAGLPHCSFQSCFMRDAEGHNTNDEENGFCENCKRVLLKHGWNI